MIGRLPLQRRQRLGRELPTGLSTAFSAARGRNLNLLFYAYSYFSNMVRSENCKRGVEAKMGPVKRSNLTPRAMPDHLVQP